MSFITGKPFVDNILGGLSESELQRLHTLINNKTPALAGTYRTYNFGSVKGDLLTGIIAENKKFKYVAISFDPILKDYRKGILCRIDDKFSFLSWEPGTKVMSEFNLTQDNYSPVNEELTTEEFRRVLADMLITGGGMQECAAIYEVSKINNISKEILNALKPGDIVQKITGKQKHAYVVSYKGDGAGEGICLTYTDASVVETVSYDRSGSNWVYNSTDITELGGTQYSAGTGIDITNNVIKAIGLECLTTAPAANNPNGIKIVILSSEPSTKYDGYLYFITGE